MMCVCHNSFLSEDLSKFTGDYFNLSERRNIQPPHIYALHIIINTFSTECMYSFCSRDQHLHFCAKKKLFLSLTSKIHFFLRRADAFHLFLHFKSMSAQQKNSCIVKFKIIYYKINCWSYCHKYIGFPVLCVHGTQISKNTQCDIGGIC